MISGIHDTNMFRANDDHVLNECPRCSVPRYNQSDNLSKLIIISL